MLPGTRERRIRQMTGTGAVFSDSARWIPAKAGMTALGPDMAASVSGMTALGPGMTALGPGMTASFWSGMAVQLGIGCRSWRADRLGS